MLCPESRKTSRGSPTAQGKNWLWKRKLTRCAGSPTTPERKNALPVLHGRSEGDFPRFRVTPQAGRTPMPGGILQKKYSIPRETPPKQEVRQAVSSGRKFPPAGKPPGQDRRRKIPIGGLCPPFSLQQVSPPGPAPTRQKANAPRPEHQQKHSGRAQIHGEQIPPFPTEKHVPPGSECCACALLPRENAFSDSPQGRLRHFLPA